MDVDREDRAESRPVLALTEHRAEEEQGNLFRWLSPAVSASLRPTVVGVLPSFLIYTFVSELSAISRDAASHIVTCKKSLERWKVLMFNRKMILYGSSRLQLLDDGKS